MKRKWPRKELLINLKTDRWMNKDTFHVSVSLQSMEEHKWTHKHLYISDLKIKRFYTTYHPFQYITETNCIIFVVKQV